MEHLKGASHVYAPGLTNKHLVRLERSAKDKHSSLLQTFVNHGRKKLYDKPNGLYYKHMTIVNDDSSGISRRDFKLIDDAIVIIYDHNIFKIQVTGP